MSAQVIVSYQTLFQMKQFCNTLKQFRKTVEDTDIVLQNIHVNGLGRSLELLNKVISDIEKTNNMLQDFASGKITLEELETWRNELAERTR